LYRVCNYSDFKNFSAEYIPVVSEDPALPTELVGSWSCWYGEQDQIGEWQINF